MYVPFCDMFPHICEAYPGLFSGAIHSYMGFLNMEFVALSINNASLVLGG